MALERNTHRNAVGIKYWLLALCAFPAHAADLPLTYTRAKVMITLAHPPQTAASPHVMLDTEIRDATLAARTPGWYSFATPGENKAAMMAYAQPAPATISAGNDFGAVDILFIDAYGVIREILPSLVPAELQESVTSAEPVEAVMYLKGGTCASLGIQPGDQVTHALFRKKTVVLSVSAPAAEEPPPVAVPVINGAAAVPPAAPKPPVILLEGAPGIRPGAPLAQPAPTAKAEQEKKAAAAEAAKRELLVDEIIKRQGGR